MGDGVVEVEGGRGGGGGVDSLRMDVEGEVDLEGGDDEEGDVRVGEEGREEAGLRAGVSSGLPATKLSSIVKEFMMKRSWEGVKRVS